MLADELWEKHCLVYRRVDGGEYMIRDAFLAAIKEAMEAVREKAAGVCEDEYSCEGIAQRCAAAIKQMELP